MKKVVKEETTDKTTLTIVKDGKEEKTEINKPTPEQVVQIKQAFEDAADAFKDKTWPISEKGSFGANDVYLFLIDFMKRFGFWTKTGWMGMIKMNEELTKALALVNDDTALELNYQALEFCAYMMTNPGGIGLDSANKFEEIADKYAKIGLIIGTQLDDARNELKKIQYMQEEWAAAEQGFFLADLEPKVEEKLQEKPVEEAPKTE